MFHNLTRSLDNGATHEPSAMKRPHEPSQVGVLCVALDALIKPRCRS